MPRTRLNPKLSGSRPLPFSLLYFRDGEVVRNDNCQVPIVCEGMDTRIFHAEIGEIVFPDSVKCPDIDGDCEMLILEASGYFVISPADGDPGGYAAVYGAHVELLPDGPSHYGIAPSLN